jgi:hypothetical protein
VSAVVVAVVVFGLDLGPDLGPGLGGGGGIARADGNRRIPPVSVWLGSYSCQQGVTALRLTIMTRSGGAATATFEFGPHPDNAKLPRGEYQMTGTVRLLARGQLQVKLAPDRWVTRPGDGWQMVGLSATSDLEQRALEGRIDAQGCGELSVQREPGL